VARHHHTPSLRRFWHVWESASRCFRILFLSLPSDPIMCRYPVPREAYIIVGSLFHFPIWKSSFSIVISYISSSLYQRLFAHSRFLCEVFSFPFQSEKITVAITYAPFAFLLSQGQSPSHVHQGCITGRSTHHSSHYAAVAPHDTDYSSIIIFEKFLR
jgi:hypothetical protein